MAMALPCILHFTSSPSLKLTPPKHQPTTTTNFRPLHHRNLCQHPPTSRRTTACAYKVVIENEGGETTELEVEPDETILSKALDMGLSIPHDCKLGVCMTCPAKLLSGTIDQSEGMLSEDVIERGYSLLCVSYPKSDCHVKIIPEEELLSLQLATADD